MTTPQRLGGPSARAAPGLRLSGCLLALVAAASVVVAQSRWAVTWRME